MDHPPPAARPAPAARPVGSGAIAGMAQPHQAVPLVERLRPAGTAGP